MQANIRVIEGALSSIGKGNRCAKCGRWAGMR